MATERGAVGEPPVYVLCVTYDSSRWLTGMLGSLAAEPVHRILIWDNSEDDLERQRTREAVANFSRVEMLGGGSNIGFGPAVNRLVERVPDATPARLWILNPDTVVSPGTVSRLASALDDNGPTAIVSPVIRTGAGSRTWFSGGDLDLRRGRTLHRTDLPRDALRSCTFLTGAALMADASAWRSLGGFREDLFLYWEDADLCRRALDAGWRLYVVRSATVWHAVGGSGSPSGRTPTYFYYVCRNRLVLARERGSVWRCLAGAGAGETMRWLVRAGRAAVRRRDTVRAALKGMHDGLRGRTGRVMLSRPLTDRTQDFARPADHASAGGAG